MNIKQMKFEVCSLCQNNCELCAHKSLMNLKANYQLTMEELKDFLAYTKQSDYFIEKLWIHGAGEPLLWKYLNEGLKMIYESGVVKSIFIASNGYSINRLHEASLKYIDQLRISVYPSFKIPDLLRTLLKKYKNKIKLEKIKVFKQINKKYIGLGKIPCKCTCKGPMYYNGNIFFFCGPPVIEAVQNMNLNIYDCNDLYQKIKLNYLDKFKENLIGNLEYCKYCWSNNNIKSKRISHR